MGKVIIASSRGGVIICFPGMELLFHVLLMLKEAFLSAQ